MAEALQPARAVAPGRILRQELEARGWSQKDLAAILGRPEQMVSEIVTGNKQITPETALDLAQALGTSAELWLNLETTYRLQQARRQQQDDVIARRSQLYDALPLRSMARRGWLALPESLAELEQTVFSFLGISVGKEFSLPARLRSSTIREPLNYAQLAWLRRAEKLANEQHVDTVWLPEYLDPLVKDLLFWARTAGDVANVPTSLARWGVRFVLLRPLEKTYLDGAAFWLKEDEPVIALTLRYSRIDSFWFTLLHEIAHLAEGPMLTFWDQLESGDNQDSGEADLDSHEITANRMAADWLVQPEVFQQFVTNTQPYFSRTSIEAFSALQSRHPGIVLGRLQREKAVSWKHLRTLLVKVAPYLQDMMHD